MKKINAIVVSIILLLLGGILFFFYDGMILPGYFGILIILELATFFLIKRLRKESALFITPDDEKPKLSQEGLEKFFAQSYDPELGWTRRPNTSKQERGKLNTITFHIDEQGSRANPHHEKWPVKITGYGDSFAFSRQVEDNETWEWYLSELTKTKVLNFGVGNYGLDQALLRLKREFPQKKSSIVIMAIVPSTIVRILGVWKHYHDYGNTFGFKPFFTVENGELVYHRNFIDSKEKFENYTTYLPKIQKYDYFYREKFKQEMLDFPYLISVFSNPLRNIPLISLFSARMIKRKKEREYEQGVSKPSKFLNFLMAMQLRLFTPMKVKLFKKEYPALLLTKLVEEFSRYGKEQGFEPVLLWMPQKDDVLFMKRRGIYYSHFVEKISKKMKVIDLTPMLMSSDNLSSLYSDDNTDGGHFSPEGNKKVAEMVYEKIIERSAQR